MSFVCWTPLLTRLQSGLAVHSLFAGQVVGSTAVFVVWPGVKGGEGPTVYSANTV